MKITTLLENHANPDQPELLSEHGLSFYIENQGHVVMSDVGQTGKFAENAAILGIDLDLVEAVAISHHHYDHGGGLERFLKENHHATIYLRQLDYTALVAEDGPGAIRTIGLDDALLNKNQDRVTLINRSQEILPGFQLITEIPQRYPEPGGDQRLKIKSGNLVRPDPFNHEMVTVFESERGLVVMTGCAHNGVMNMIAATRKALPGKPILALVGGFHLVHEEPETVREVGKLLLAEDIPSIYTGHCTGDNAVEILEQVLGPRLHRLYCGLEIEMP